MSRFCIFALFLVLVFQFGNCIDCDNITSKPGSDKTSLSPFEKLAELLKKILKPAEKVKEGIDKIGEIIGNNSKSSKKSTLAEILSEPVAEKIRLIFPGTLWCGDGDIAKNESDLGLFNKTDACCRAHDNCKDDLLASETKANLENNGIFTRSACICDSEFYNCLKEVDDVLSNGIGKTYFNVLQPQCYTCVCPSSNCKSNDRMKCEESCKQYEWVNNSKY